MERAAVLQHFVVSLNVWFSVKSEKTPYFACLPVLVCLSIFTYLPFESFFCQGERTTDGAYDSIKLFLAVAVSQERHCIMLNNTHAHLPKLAHSVPLQCVTACCSVLQRVAACCSVLQRVAACCNVFPFVDTAKHTATR